MSTIGNLSWEELYNTCRQSFCFRNNYDFLFISSNEPSRAYIDTSLNVNNIHKIYGNNIDWEFMWIPNTQLSEFYNDIGNNFSHVYATYTSAKILDWGLNYGMIKSANDNVYQLFRCKDNEEEYALLLFIMLTKELMKGDDSIVLHNLYQVLLTEYKKKNLYLNHIRGKKISQFCINTIKFDINDFNDIALLYMLNIALIKNQSQMCVVLRIPDKNDIDNNTGEEKIKLNITGLDKL